ncbi:MAG: bifunctional phosphoglucose/phosphomannose isomerase [Fimbriimonas sp.]|nr:bifunctional phosphoglucose/phosphomannose isomerase [Fimbriimonas sp.]
MAVDLDDRSVVSALDPDGMLALVEDLPTQCLNALEVAEQLSLRPLDRRPNLVVIGGMGAAATCGDIVRALFEEHAAVPIHINRDYRLPAFVGVGDLVFCVSYSGDTEETLSMYAEAKRFGAKIIAITSGGKLKELAEADGNSVYLVPGGQPPRTALGYMLIPMLVALQQLKLLHRLDIRGAIGLLEGIRRDLGVDSAGNAAKKLAQRMKGSVPILYGLGTWQTLIAHRWRTQINTNAKMLAFVNGYPDLDHNEIVGWHDASRQGVQRFVGVVLEGGAETDRLKLASSVTERLVGRICVFEHVTAQGETLLEKILSLAYFGDFLSIYLARLNDVDPETIEPINKLKDALSIAG